MLDNMYRQAKIEKALGAVSQREKDEWDTKEKMQLQQASQGRDAEKNALEMEKFERQKFESDRNYELNAQKNQLALQKGDLSQQEFEQKKKDDEEKRYDPYIKSANENAMQALDAENDSKRMRALVDRISSARHTGLGSMSSYFDSSDNRLFESMTNKIAILARPIGMPLRTNAEVKFVQDMAPNINDGKQAILEKLDNIDAVSRNRVDYSKYVREQKKNGVSPSDIEGMWVDYEQENPLVIQTQDGLGQINKNRKTFDEWQAEKRLEASLK